MNDASAKAKKLGQTFQPSSSESRQLRVKCDRCDGIGVLTCPVSQEVEGKALKYTAAARCNCLNGERYRGLPMYDEQPASLPSDNHISLYKAELVMWHGREAGHEFMRLVEEARAGRHKTIADILATLRRKFPTVHTTTAEKIAANNAPQPEEKPNDRNDDEEILPF